MKPTTFLFADFIAYVRNPQYTLTEQPDGTWRDRLRLMWALWRTKAKIGFSLAILAALLQHLVSRHTGLTFDHSFHQKGWVLVLSLVVLAPLLEEALFRGLLKPRAGQLAAVAFLIAVYAFRHTFDDGAADNELPMLLTLAGLVLIPVLVHRICKSARCLACLERVWQAHFRLIFYGVAIGFGVVHLSNFQHLTVWHYLLVPVLTLPQLFSGFYLGYVRMKYGIWYGIALHAIWNALPAGLTVAYLMMN